MPCSVITLRLSVSGASLVKALASLSVKLSLRRLPTMRAMGYGVAMGIPLKRRRRMGCSGKLAMSCKKMQVHVLASHYRITKQTDRPTGGLSSNFARADQITGFHIGHITAEESWLKPISPCSD